MIAGSALWYFARGTGVVSLVLLTASMVLGIMASVRWERPSWPRFVTQDLHRNVSLLVLLVIAAHIVTAELDSFVHIGWPGAIIPFVSPYRPVWLGLGALSFDLLVAVTLTSLLRRHIGYPLWRGIHWASYACWPFALLHGLATGSDTRVGWVLVSSLVCLGAVVLAVWWRLAVAARPDPRAVLGSGGLPDAWMGAAVAASVIIPMAIVAFTFFGPARSGWAARAGTPASALNRSP